eukprot:1074360-Pelagomonas_calceolata.AAC.1
MQAVQADETGIQLSAKKLEEANRKFQEENKAMKQQIQVGCNPMIIRAWLHRSSIEDDLQPPIPLILFYNLRLGYALGRLYRLQITGRRRPPVKTTDCYPVHEKEGVHARMDKACCPDS